MDTISQLVRNAADTTNWILPSALFIVAILQFLYILRLNATSREGSSPRQPTEPVMPTTPEGATITQTQSGIATHPPGMESAAQPSQPMPSMNIADGIVAKFVVMSGLPGRPEMNLPGSNFNVGRFQNPQLNISVALDEHSVSRRHATFTGDPALGEYYLTDTNSSYGTHIRIENHFERLSPGVRERVYNEDIVRFGNEVTVRLVLPCDTRASATRL